jgi:biopolymer transport protein ExbB
MGSTLGDIFVRGGWVMWPLLIFSVLLWAVVIERTIVFLTLRPRLRRLVEQVAGALSSGDVNAARQLCLAERVPVSGVLLPMLEPGTNREAATRAAERNRARLTGHLKRHLWILGTIGTASPFIGLLGTVVGILAAFHQMAETGAGGFSVVAAGISEALIATAAGLIVAILALLAYNVFVTSANQLITNVRITVDELFDAVFSPSSRQGA